MLYYKDEKWLTVFGASRFEVYIQPSARKREDVMFQLEMRFVAGGARWRRVQSWHRPSIWLTLSSFRVPGRSWKDLEQLNYLGEVEVDEFDWPTGTSGFLDVSFVREWPKKTQENIMNIGCNWRVLKRDAGWFTIEMAELLDITELPAEQVVVLEDGTEETVKLDSEFWKKHANFYLIEEVPFGIVTVRVPRNARDVEAYALARARELVGVGEPEHIKVVDTYKKDKPSQKRHDDIYVHLHFNGYYEG